jgi:hypothetical protein
MSDTVSLALVQSVIDAQKDLVAIFHNDEIIMTNKSFNTFFAVSSCAQYKTDFGLFINNFVPHPSYFNKDKIEADETWFDAILKLPELDRIVSMMTPSFEPHAFAVAIDNSVSEHCVVTFSDITQTLIKRIMIENNANMDIQSGAYAKEYFLHVAQSYEDAANFNEKILGAILIHADKKDGSDLSNDSNALNALVSYFRSSIRQDDMLIRWSSNTFVLIFLVDIEDNAMRMFEKLQGVIAHDNIKELQCQLSLHVQEKSEDINSLIRRINA